MPEEKTPEEIDTQIQKENKEKTDARAKLVDDIVNRLHDEFEKNRSMEGLQSVIKEVADRISGTQIIAAGATSDLPEPEERPTFPVIAKPLQDGTPVANIRQVQPEAGKPGQTKPSPAAQIKK